MNVVMKCVHSGVNGDNNGTLARTFARFEKRDAQGPRDTFGILELNFDGLPLKPGDLFQVEVKPVNTVKEPEPEIPAETTPDTTGEETTPGEEVPHA